MWALRAYFSQNDLDSPVLLTAHGIVRAVRFLVGSYWLRLSPSASADPRRRNAGILHQPDLYRRGPVLRKLHVVGVRALAIGVSFDGHCGTGIGGCDLPNFPQRCRSLRA